MQFVELVQEVIESKSITSTLKDELNEQLWSHQFDNSEVVALEQLFEALIDGTVTVVPETQN